MDMRQQRVPLLQLNRMGAVQPAPGVHHPERGLGSRQTLADWTGSTDSDLLVVMVRQCDYVRLLHAALRHSVTCIHYSPERVARLWQNFIQRSLVPEPVPAKVAPPPKASSTFTHVHEGVTYTLTFTDA